MWRTPGRSGRQFQALQAGVGPSPVVEYACAPRFAVLKIGQRSRLGSLRGHGVGKGGPYHLAPAEGSATQRDKRAAEAGNGPEAVSFPGQREMASNVAENTVACAFGTSDQFYQ